MSDHQTTTADAMERWVGAVTHLLDELAEAAGPEIDRAELIESYNALTGQLWTTEYVRRDASGIM